MGHAGWVLPFTAYGSRARPGRFDEVTQSTGQARAHWPALLDAFEQLGSPELTRRGTAAERLAAAAGFALPAVDADPTSAAPVDAVTGPALRDDPARRVDPIPVVFGAEDWHRLQEGIAQRVRLLELMAADLYGERSLVRRGLVPVDAILGSPHYLAAAHGWPATGTRLSRYAVDITRDASGEFVVLEDHTENPVGAGRALLLRSVLTRLFGVEHRRLRVQPLGPWFDALRSALAELVPSAATSPRVAVLAPSPTHRDYAEQALLATQLGYNLVDAGDLTVQGGSLYLRAIGGLEPIGVLLRAVPDSALDPLEIVPPTAAGVAGLLQAARRNRLGLSNAAGSGLVGGTDLHRFLPALCQALLGEDLLLASATMAGERATTPVLRAGELVADSYVMRLHAVQNRDGVAVLPGGVARSSGGVKDVWVVGDSSAPARTMATATATAGALQPIDLRDSLPCRAAEALFWLGRNAEHAENVARCVHVALSTFRADPELADLDGGAWAQRVISVLTLLVGARSVDSVATAQAWADDGAFGPDGIGLVARAREALSDRPDGLADTLGHLAANAATVREFLSTSTWRLTDALLSERSRLTQPTQVNGVDLLDLLDRTLASLAALAGLMQESVVRGPGWRFFDLGRRLERSRLMVTTLRAAFSVVSPMVVAGAVGEFVLASTESLVAYRRRYRTDIELDSLLDLLVADDRNPRSLAFQVDRIREDLASLPDRDGLHDEAALLERLAGQVTAVRADHTLEATLHEMDDLLAALVRGVGHVWFSPRPVGRDVSTEPR
jgi:uncharacterized circularly permuted ATP-grasp superfamily protein/uncharacterized alpha-E superfamily protein